MAATVIDALRRFLPGHLRQYHTRMNEAQRRAVWAITHCRSAEMGGHLHGCGACGKKEFHFHSCNHRSCPQCGKQATGEWVERELGKRVGAPYFMVTFTLPEELSPLFFTYGNRFHPYDIRSKSPVVYAVPDLNLSRQPHGGP